MNRFNVTLLAAVAALGLQACDVEVRDAPRQESAAVTESVPATPPVAQGSSAPDGMSSSPSSTTAAAPEGLPADAGTVPVADGSAPLGNPAAPQAPTTTEMGAAPGMPATTGMPLPADTTAAGVAAPTELARFLQENPPGQRTAKADEAAKAQPAGADAKRDSAKAGKS